MNVESESIRRLNLGRPTEERLENLEIQSDIHTSRLDSEMGTRSRAHAALHTRLSTQDQRLLRIERINWMIGGGLLAFNFIGFAMLARIIWGVLQAIQKLP